MRTGIKTFGSSFPLWQHLEKLEAQLLGPTKAGKVKSVLRFYLSAICKFYKLLTSSPGLKLKDDPEECVD